MDIAFQDTQIEFGECCQNFDACLELGYKPSSFGIIPFTADIKLMDPYANPTIMFGSTRLAKMAYRGQLPENGIVFYDAEKFDQHYYSQILEDHLLNFGGRFWKWGDLKHQVLTRPAFVKPSSDLKYFAGGVFDPCDDSLERVIYNEKMVDIDFTDDTMCLVNFNLVNIVAEYRAFVVNNSVLDICQYIVNGKVVPAELSQKDKDYICIYIESIQLMYEPHSHYVIDIAKLSNGQLRVMEYNCINCSGNYKIDRKKLYQTMLEL